MASQTLEDNYITVLEKLQDALTSIRIMTDQEVHNCDSLDKIISYIKTQKEKTILEEKFKLQTSNFKNKIEMISSFIKYSEELTHSKNICVYGSFVRSLFEKIFLSSAEVIGYGDPINHDIDIAIYFDIDDYKLNKEKFTNFIEQLKNLILLSRYDDNYYFGNYKIISVLNKTITNLKASPDQAEPGFIRKVMMDIPHYNIILKNKNNDLDLIKIDLLAYKEIASNMWGNDFDINSLKITNLGIKSNCDNFFEILSSILNKTATCQINFETITNMITDGYTMRSEKEKILNQIIYFLTHRTKILELGYTEIYSDTSYFDISTETENSCTITGNEPPFIKIKLECNHELSLMAIAGLINIRSSEYTEAINCPLCREKLKFKLIEKIPEKIKSPNTVFKSEFVEIPEYEKTNLNNSIDNINYVAGLLSGLTLQQINEYREINANTTPNTWNVRPNTLTRIRRTNGELYP